MYRTSILLAWLVKIGLIDNIIDRKKDHDACIFPKKYGNLTGMMSY